MGYGTIDVELTTAIGPITAHFTDAKHVAVRAGSERATPHVNDSNPTIVVAGKEYVGMVHLYAPDWTPKVNDCGSWTAREGWGKDATPAKRRKIDAIISEAIAEYVKSNPDTLRQAEIKSAELKFKSTYRECEEAKAAYKAAQDKMNEARRYLDGL